MPMMSHVFKQVIIINFKSSEYNKISFKLLIIFFVDKIYKNLDALNNNLIYNYHDESIHFNFKNDRVKWKYVQFACCVYS